MRKSDVILGIGGYTAESAACLIIDDEILGAVEEERFTRVKHQGGWPKQSINFLLKKFNIKESDITYISFCYDPWIRISRRIPYRLTKTPTHPLISSYIIFNEIKFVSEFILRLKKLKRESDAKVYFIRHHIAHVASSFYTSLFKEAAFYSIDQRGEWESTLWGKCENNDIHILGNVNYPHSLGIFYAGITEFLGFKSYDEYKVMGLSSYGKPVYLDKFRKLIFPVKENKFKINIAYFKYHIDRGFLGGSFFTKKFHEEFGPPRRNDESISQYHMDIAASAQKIFEECVLHQLNYLYKQVKSENLCISGGCGMNGVMNGKVYTETPFKHIYLPPVSADNGLGLGGALFIKHKILGHKIIKPLLRADLGSEYSNSDIENLLKLYKLDYKFHADIISPTVELLMSGKIIGWFQGGMEFGARALGYRSILANPTLPNMKDKINKFVKFRESFRPFAPSVIEEEAQKYFCINDPIPFMTVVCKVKKRGIEKLPATTHVDYTARVHTVNREHNLLYWKLIYEFGKKSGVPVVLNTSFNIMGEPIVENPQQAIRCFYSNGIDALVMGNFILRKTI